MDSVGHDPLRDGLSTVVDEATKESSSPSSPWDPGANGWEHGTIEHYLVAAASWGAAGLGVVGERKADNPWQRCAEILWAGKGYE